MNKMDGKSMDLTAENIAQLKKLFPEAVTEGKVDFEVLKALLGGEVETRKEYYKFTWNGKETVRAYARIPSKGTLRPCVEESSGKDGTPGKFDSENLYIEGDNLEVLKLLQGSYHKKIKMIYIDPPYNTGKDFVYPDNYHDSIGEYKALTGQTDAEGKSTRANPETSGRYHTDWLKMMYPRLILARNLLTDDGVIFISIDDNEIDNLKKLCNEVFGEENFVAQLIWKSGGTSASYFTNEHEFILCYAKQKSSLSFFIYNGDTKISDRAIKRESLKNPASEIKFPAGIDFESTDKIFPNKFGDKETVNIVNGVLEAKNGKLANEVTIKAAWTMKDMILSWLSGESVIDQKGQKIIRFFFKSNGVLQYEKEKGTLHPSTIIEGITTKQGTIALEQLFSFNTLFSFPKPPLLIKKFLKYCSTPDSIILDFFSGSATTAHAVMQLNAEDGGNRKFIMIQLPEPCEEGTEAAKAGYKNICEIGKERIRRAANKLREEKPLDCQGKDMGFKVFKLDTSNLREWNPNSDTLAQDLLDAVNNILAGRTTEDLLYEVLLKCNLPLTLPIEERKVECVIANGKTQTNTIYVVGMGALAICLDENIPQTIAEEIVKLRNEYAPVVPMQVVFRDNGFDDVSKTNALQILKQAGFEEKSIQTF